MNAMRQNNYLQGHVLAIRVRSSFIGSCGLVTGVSKVLNTTTVFISLFDSVVLINMQIHKQQKMYEMLNM